MGGFFPLQISGYMAFLRELQTNASVTWGLRKIMQPGGASSFFKGHVQTAAQAVNKLQNRFGFRFEDRLHHQIRQHPEWRLSTDTP